MQAKRSRCFVYALVGLFLCQAGLAYGGTVAYWRFEEGPVDAKVTKGGTGDGVYFPGTADSSGNGNALSAWSEADWAGMAYRTDVPSATVAQTGDANKFSVQNTGDYPGMYTNSASLRSWSPAAFTIEASYKPRDGGYRTIVGRDSQNTASTNGALAALYLQLIPGDAVAIKYADAAGYWHEAISAAGAVKTYTGSNSAAGHWYNIAAVSDGSKLSLYMKDVDAGTDYQLLAQTDLTISGSPNLALNPGAGSGGDWQGGNFSVGRGLYGGGHTDRGYGLIDEVRLTDGALGVNQFLASVPEPATLSAMGLFGLLAMRRRNRSR